ncbi:MAG: GAF domain-containing protein [Anaerolineales bacterium]|nr:GAF domain-containing protein [Anaerolineales bacterium]
MLDHIRAFMAPPRFSDSEEARTARLLNTAIWAVIIATSLTGISLTFIGVNFSAGTATSAITGGSSMMLVLLMFGLRRLLHRGHVRAASILLAATLFTIITLNTIVFGGVRNSGTSGFVLAIILSSLLLNDRTILIIFTTGSVLATFVVYYLESVGLIFVPLAPTAGLIDWLLFATIFSLVALLVQYAVRNLNDALDRANRSEQDLAESNRRLQELNLSLEERVAERTRALELSTVVSRRLSTILDEARLISAIVSEIQRAFKYYHVHIYLLDEANGRLVMASGTGEAGEQMRQAGHALPLGRGLVGRAGQTQSTVLVPNTSLSAEWLPNPLLPETKAEIAVPIALGERVLGVLDVQHNVINGLGIQDTDLLESIASQAAIALQNAGTLREAQQRAEQEATLNTIVQKIQSTTSINDALQVTVRELGHALGAPAAQVRLASAQEIGHRNGESA